MAGAMATCPNGNGFLRPLLRCSVLFYVTTLVAVAVKSASGVTGERETGTWDGVLGTPLEPTEIVRAKVLGAIARPRALLSLVLGPWLFGLALGALHPIGLLVAMTGLAVFLYFASALGTLFSLRSKTSGQALVRTLGVLLMLNLGTLVIGALLIGSCETSALFGNTILLLYYLPVETSFMNGILTHPLSVLLFLGILSTGVVAYAALVGMIPLPGTMRPAEFDRVSAADRPSSPWGGGVSRLRNDWLEAAAIPMIKSNVNPAGQ